MGMILSHCPSLRVFLSLESVNDLSNTLMIPMLGTYLFNRFQSPFGTTLKHYNRYTILLHCNYLKQTRCRTIDRISCRRQSTLGINGMGRAAAETTKVACCHAITSIGAPGTNCNKLSRRTISAPMDLILTEIA